MCSADSSGAMGVGMRGVCSVGTCSSRSPSERGQWVTCTANWSSTCCLSCETWRGATHCMERGCDAARTCADVEKAPTSQPTSSCVRSGRYVRRRKRAALHFADFLVSEGLLPACEPPFCSLCAIVSSNRSRHGWVTWRVRSAHSRPG